MFDEQDDPFSGVTFTTPAPDPSVGADEIIRMFVETSQGSGPSETVRDLSPMRNRPPMENVEADTKGGAARVNANTSQTGVVAYKDSKGTTNLTNVAKDPLTGQEQPLMRAPKMGEPDAVRAIDGPVGLQNILTKLSNTSDPTVARALFNSYQTAAVEAATNLEGQAIAMASVKTGAVALEKELIAAEAADRSDPKWMPGIGDSPITAGIRKQLESARGYTEAEAKRSLTGNFAYKVLQTSIKQAQSEMERVTKLADAKTAEEARKAGRKELQEDRQEERRNVLEMNKTEEERRFNRGVAEKKRVEEEKDLEQAEQLTNEQRTRIQMLNQGEIEDVTTKEGKLKAIRLVAKNPDKHYKAAVFASEAELPALALKGNKYARSLVMAIEEKNTGKSQLQIQQDLDDLTKQMNARGFVEGNIIKFSGDKKAAEANIAKFREANAESLLGGKKDDDKVTDIKVHLALQQVKQRRQERFETDVSSWESLDPALAIAARRASHLPGGRNIDNVLNAYLVDDKWIPLTGKDYITKLMQFQSTMHEAAKKHEKSLFGMPDYRAVDKMIADRMIEGNVFRKYLNVIKNVATPIVNQFGVPGDLEALGFMIHNSDVGRNLRDTLGITGTLGDQTGKEQK